MAAIKPFPSNGAVSAGQQLVAGRPGLRLHGWAAREAASAAAAATFFLRHGISANDATVYPVELLANESRSEGPAAAGIDCPNGIYLDVTAGTVEVTVFASNEEAALG